MKARGRFVSKKTASYIREMYNRTEADRIIRMTDAKRIRLVSVLLVGSVLLSVPVFILDSASQRKPVTALTRNDYKKGSRTVTLTARTDAGDEESIVVAVPEREYSEEETEKMADSLGEKLLTTIKGRNTDPENIVYDLTLPDHIDGFPFEITWRSDRPLILGSNGVINRKMLFEEDKENSGICVCLCATLKYKRFSQDRYLNIVVRKNDPKDEDSIRSAIEDGIRSYDEKSRTDREQILPRIIGDRKVFFYNRTVNRGFFIPAAGIIAAFFVIAKRDEGIKKEAIARRRQIDEDHAGILNRYALFHTAGINSRMIWKKLCSDYEEKLAESEKNRRYVYDEMILTKKMMDEGTGEIAAYDDFAMRIGSIRYRSFVSLIKQSVISGGGMLSHMLIEETEKSLRDRLSSVRRQAAEAQTRMLIPMIMMLIVVIAIVCIPAFVNLYKR